MKDRELIEAMDVENNPLLEPTPLLKAKWRECPGDWCEDCKHYPHEDKGLCNDCMSGPPSKWEGKE